jgi:hypothetical protein
MQWLRRAGLLYRLRALVLLVSFAVGSLIARDAAYIHQVLSFTAAESIDLDAIDLEVPSVTAKTPKLKARPKGITRRMAWNPWDPPDDDDELDEDSDTTAVAHLRLALLPAELRQLLEADFVAVRAPVSRPADGPRLASLRSISSRGPPRAPIARR